MHVQVASFGMMIMPPHTLLSSTFPLGPGPNGPHVSVIVLTTSKSKSIFLQELFPLQSMVTVGAEKVAPLHTPCCPVQSACGKERDISARERTTLAALRGRVDGV